MYKCYQEVAQETRAFVVKKRVTELLATANMQRQQHNRIAANSTNVENFFVR